MKRRWLAGLKECNLLDNRVGDFLNVGQKVCKLPRPLPSKRQVKPKMEAWGMRKHTYFQCGIESLV